MGYYDNFPGYENPLGTGGSSVGGDYSWGDSSKGTDWNQTPSIDWNLGFGNQGSGNRWTDALNVASKYLNSRSSGTSNTPYTDRARQRRSSGNNIFQATPEVTIIQDPAQPKKTTTTGGSSGGGIGSAIGGVVGAIGGSFIPGVGTGLGASLGSGVGGLFG